MAIYHSRNRLYWRDAHKRIRLIAHLIKTIKKYLACTMKERCNGNLIEFPKFDYHIHIPCYSSWLFKSLICGLLVSSVGSEEADPCVTEHHGMSSIHLHRPLSFLLYLLWQRAGDSIIIPACNLVLSDAIRSQSVRNILEYTAFIRYVFKSNNPHSHGLLPQI